MIVSDGIDNSSPSSVKIILDNGFFPVADAGNTIYVDGSNPVSLDATGSYDRDGQPEELVYSWAQISGPEVSISDANSPTPSISGFVQTNSVQTCEFELVVSDGEYLSLPDVVKLQIVPMHPASSLVLANGPFDANKPTIVFFDGGNGTSGGANWWFSESWTSQANAFSFTHYQPDASGSTKYYHCGDMLICYLSQAAPDYNKAIQVIGYSTGGQPAMDTGIRP